MTDLHPQNTNRDVRVGILTLTMLTSSTALSRGARGGAVG